jgi:WD40 repeat protein
VSLLRRFCLLSALAAAPASALPPAPGPQLRTVLGQPDLAAPVRILELTWLAGSDELLAWDASGVAQLWNPTLETRRGVVAAAPVLLSSEGLRPAPAGVGCLLSGPVVPLSAARLARAGNGWLEVCDESGQTAAVKLSAPGFTEEGTALAVTPSGDAAAQGTATGEVLRLSLPGGEVSRLRVHEGRVLALHLGGEGKLLTVGADGALRTFGPGNQRLRSLDAVPGARHLRPGGCEGESVQLAAFSSDASLLLLGTVAGDGLEPCSDVPVPARLRLLELPQGRVRWEVKGIQASAAAFASDGALWVALALRPGEPGDANPSTVLRLDAKSGKPFDGPRGHRAPLTVLRFSPDGRALWSADAAGTWKRWALESGREAATATHPVGAILDLRLLPNEGVLTEHEDDSVRLWRADGTLVSVVVAPPQADPTALSPACRAEQEQLRAALAGMRPRPSPLALRDPGRYAGLTAVPELVLSADAETVLAPVAEESCVSLSRNGCPSGCRRTYHLERVALRSRRTVQTLAVDEELLGGCVPPAGAFVTRGERAGMNLRSSTGTLTGHIGVALGRVTSCETTPDGRRMLVATPRTLSVWDAAAFAGPVEATPRRARAPGPVAFSPHGDLSVDVDGGELRLRSWPKGAFVARLSLGPQDDAPTAMAFAPDGASLAVGTARGVVYLYALPRDGSTAVRSSP